MKRGGWRLSAIGCNVAKDQRAGCYTGLLTLVLSLSEGMADVAGKAGKGIGDGLNAGRPADGAQALVLVGMEFPQAERAITVE